jgi:hypothetical protein
MSAAIRQLEFALDAPPRDGAELLRRLRALGLRNIETCRLTENRAVMVSFQGTELRVHRAYLAAPGDVLAAIVSLVNARTRAARAFARRVILGFPVPAEMRRVRRPRREPALSGRDARAVAKLDRQHAEYNARHFAGALGAIQIRLSDRMRSRLGHYAPAAGNEPAHIAIGRRHLRRDGWSAACETLLHEMIHQWQGEHGLPLDHRARFRAKALALGIPASAVAERGAPSAEPRRVAFTLQSLFNWG